MRVLIILFILMNFSFAYSQGPWVNGNAVWKYRYLDSEMPDVWGLIEVKKTGNVIRNGILCDQLITTKYQYSIDSPYQVVAQFTIDTNYTYKSFTGDTIFYEQMNEFRTLYDFSGSSDSLFIHYSNESGTITPCNDSSFTYCTTGTNIQILGDSYRIMGTWPKSLSKYSLGANSGNSTNNFNERFGLICTDKQNWLFPRKSGECWVSESNMLDWVTFLCFSDDSLYHDVDCNYFETLGLSDNAFEVNITPNPFMHTIRITSSNEWDRISIVDLNGREVVRRSEFEQEMSLNTDDLRSGVYVMMVEFKPGTIIRKILVKP